MSLDTSPAISIPAGYMADNKGRLVRENQIKPADLLQDQMVRKILGYADDLSSQIQRFKGHVFDDVGSFLDLLAEKYDAQKGGRKGNMTFTTYDGLFQVKVSVADTLTFGPELQIAKNLIDGCIRDWSDGANDNVMALVQHAFRVDREGQVSREAIFALRKVQIDDSRWRGAMEAIADSIRVTGSKTYLRFYRRPSPTERWEQVTIDLASA